MKKIILILLCNILFFQMLAQDNNVIKYMNNKIKWHIAYSRIDQNDPSSFSILRLKTDIPDKVKCEFNQLSNKQIISFLKNDTTCWATNLLLYEKYDKIPASYLAQNIKSKTDWEKTGLKKIEVQQWIKQLN